MSSRVGGPRSGAPTMGIGRHKQDNERRNQELQKLSVLDGGGPLSKSLTEGDPNHGSTRAPRPRKKAQDPMAGKSFMKATSSSSLKKAMESRDVSPSKVKQRVASPTNVMSKSDHQVMSKSDPHVQLRRTSSRRSVDSNSNRLSVFDRLSKTDTNKESSKAEMTSSSKSLDRKGGTVDKTSVKRRSGVFNDKSIDRRKSGVFSDKSIDRRKSGVFNDNTSDKRKSGVFSDTSGGGTAAVPLRRDSNVRRSAGRGGGGNRDSRADLSEKHAGEDKPESSDKDAKEEWSSTAIKPANESQQHEAASTGPAAGGSHVGGKATTPHQPLMTGDKGAPPKAVLPQTGYVIPAEAAATSATGHAQAPAAGVATNTSSPSHRQQQGKRGPTTTEETNKSKPKDVHKATASTAPGANKPTAAGKAPVTSPAKPEVSVTVTQPATDAKKSPAAASGVGKPPKCKTQKNTVSVAAVSRLAERVNTGQVKPSKVDDTKVLDDDKDVCDDDKASEDREFYRIKVQTRLVSYENNTLVIKNTAKPQLVPDEEEESGVDDEDPEQCHDSCTGADAATNISSLQTSSAEPAAPSPVVGGSSSQGHQGDELLEEVDEAHEEDEGGFTRSRSLRLKMSNFMSKGKNFLSDVYSSTQQSLQPHLSQLPGMNRSFQNKMSRSLTSEYSSGDALSLMSFSSSTSSHWDTRSLPAADTDSGYYSIHTSPDQGPHTPLPGAEDLDEPCEITGTDILTLVPPPPREDDVQVLTAPVQVELDAQDQSATDMDYTDSPDGKAPAEILINDDWLKRCIVNCTCQCRMRAWQVPSLPRRRRSKDLSSPSEGSLDSGHGSDEGSATSGIDSDYGGPTLGESEATGGTSTSGSAEAPADVTAVASPSDGSSSRLPGECHCECHGGDRIPNLQQQVLQEVPDLLDHDHARMWWTITGNFGNILPIDWSKTYTRQQYLPVLNLNEAKDNCNNESDEGEGGEEEEVAQDLDLHHLILSGLNEEPVKSAEEVIREIDDIMQEGSSSEDEGLEETMSCSTETQSTQPEMRPLPPPLYEEKLKNLSVNELNEHYMELEVVIRQYSETLINQLALRDELEYEKELKNSFISLLLQVQNKRRNFNVEKKQKKKYLTTVIPYDVGHGPPSNQTLQILIKILTAINEDSPTVPTLLTDYILKVLCPS